MCKIRKDVTFQVGDIRVSCSPEFEVWPDNSEPGYSEITWSVKVENLWVDNGSKMEFDIHLPSEEEPTAKIVGDHLFKTIFTKLNSAFYSNDDEPEKFVIRFDDGSYNFEDGHEVSLESATRYDSINEAMLAADGLIGVECIVCTKKNQPVSILS